jgi:hypothetical protein
VFSFLPVSGMGLVNPEGYIALSLFPHLSVLSRKAPFVALRNADSR